MLIGAHMSIAGGVPNAILEGMKYRCTAVQLFVKSSNQWKARPLAAAEISRFHELQDRTGMLAVGHDSYLINLASPDRGLLRRSRDAFLLELERCESLRIPYLVTHPGSHRGAGEARGLDTIVESIDRLHEKSRGLKVMICLETTAGQGSGLGHRFEQLGFVLKHVGESARVGVCLDTCHIFAAGYDIRTPEAYRGTMKRFDRLVGLDRLKVVHLNDARKDLGSRVDRHEHIGKGRIGRAPFGFFLNDPRLKQIPFLLETPKGDKRGNLDMDAVNLAVLRGLIREKTGRR
jgi:deoxyribonuclease-4